MAIEIVYVYRYWDDAGTIPAMFVQVNDKKYEACILEPDDATRTIDTKVIGTYDNLGQTILALQEFHQKANEITDATIESIHRRLTGRKDN